MLRTRWLAWILVLGTVGPACFVPFDGDDATDGGGDAGPEVCGNADLETGEACDDGNTEDGDGCDAACQVEPGWRCLGEPSLCEWTCGDGVLDLGEECDGPELGGETCESLPLGYAGGTLACTEVCTWDVTTCRLASCGDGIVDTGEACDDGAANSDTQPDACRTYCALPSCGDGVVDSGEACDAGSGNSDSLPNVCRTTCALPSCGDGVIDSDEACDDGAANSDTQPDACRTDCNPSTCGDGVTDTGEACDDGVANSDTQPDACRSACILPACGDDVVDSGEACDEGTANSNTQPTTCLTSCTVPPPTWDYTYYRVDQPDDGGCGEWGKIAEVQFMLSGAYFVNTATNYTTGLTGGQTIVSITSSGDSPAYGPAWQAFDGANSAWQKASGSSYYWIGNESLTLQVASPIYAEAVRVGGFWGSAVCMRLSGSSNGTSWDVLGTQCNTDCNSPLVYQP